MKPPAWRVGLWNKPQLRLVRLCPVGFCMSTNGNHLRQLNSFLRIHTKCGWDIYYGSFHVPWNSSHRVAYLGKAWKTCSAHWTKVKRRHYVEFCYFCVDPCWSQTHDPLASASWGLQVYAITLGESCHFLIAGPCWGIFLKQHLPLTRH